MTVILIQTAESASMGNIVCAYSDDSGFFVQTRPKEKPGVLSPRAKEAKLLFRLTGNLECAKFKQQLLLRASKVGFPEDKITRFFVN